MVEHTTAKNHDVFMVERLGFSDSIIYKLLKECHLGFKSKYGKEIPFFVCFYLFVVGFVCFTERLAQIRHRLQKSESEFCFHSFCNNQYYWQRGYTGPLGQSRRA